jgi:hypothetical protein
LPCPDDDDDVQQQQTQDVYYYNTATRSIRWSLPDELQALLTPTSTTQLAPTVATATTAGVPQQHQDPPTAATGETPSAAAVVRHKHQDPPAPPAAAAEAAAGAGVLSPGAYQALIELQEERVMPPLAAITSGTDWRKLMLGVDE